MDAIKKEIFPRALMVAAKTFAKKPAVVGGILVALVNHDDSGLSDVQKYVLEECREEIEERIAKRKNACERKRAQRAKGVK